MFLPPLNSLGNGRLAKVTSSENVFLSPLQNNNTDHLLAGASGLARPTNGGQPKCCPTCQSIKLMICNEA